MAEQGFSRNISTDVSTPKVQAPNFSNNRSAVEDVADVAQFGLSLFNNVQNQKKAERVAANEEDIASEALAIDALKLDLQDQGITSTKANAAIMKRLARHSNVKKQSILKMSIGRTGATVKDAATAEVAERNRFEK